MPSNTEAAEDSSAAVDTPEEPSHGRLEYKKERQRETSAEMRQSDTVRVTRPGGYLMGAERQKASKVR